MIRRQHLAIPCGPHRLAATLDQPEGGTIMAGLLIISGGNEPRSGSGGMQARLAARIAAAGCGVLRFDRRGVGDSDGENTGFRHAQPDIAAALSTLRQVVGTAPIIAFGNCDAASALMLGAGCGVDGLALANPWTIEHDTGEHGTGEGAHGANPSAQWLRAHYRRRLTNGPALRRLLAGQIPLHRLMAALLGALRPGPGPGELARSMATGLAAFGGPVRILIATQDRTAHAFLAHWHRGDPRLRHCPDAGHGFLEATAEAWLADQLLELCAMVANSCAATNRSASSAAIQPVPAAVTACR